MRTARRPESNCQDEQRLPLALSPKHSLRDPHPRYPVFPTCGDSSCGRVWSGITGALYIESCMFGNSCSTNATGRSRPSAVCRQLVDVVDRLHQRHNIAIAQVKAGFAGRAFAAQPGDDLRQVGMRRRGRAPAARCRRGQWLRSRDDRKSSRWLRRIPPRCSGDYPSTRRSTASAARAWAPGSPAGESPAASRKSSAGRRSARCPAQTSRARPWSRCRVVAAGQDPIRLQSHQRLVAIQELPQHLADQRRGGQRSQRLHGIELERMIGRACDLHQRGCARMGGIADECRRPRRGKRHVRRRMRHQRQHVRQRLPPQAFPAERDVLQRRVRLDGFVRQLLGLQSRRIPAGCSGTGAAPPARNAPNPRDTHAGT